MTFEFEHPVMPFWDEVLESRPATGRPPWEPFEDGRAEAAIWYRLERFGDMDLPFLSCVDLAVFKAFFNHTKDWADLEEMHQPGTLDVDRVLGILVWYVGPIDERIDRLRALSWQPVTTDRPEGPGPGPLPI